MAYLYSSLLVSSTSLAIVVGLYLLFTGESDLKTKRPARADE